jgi:hypothetical protein
VDVPEAYEASTLSERARSVLGQGSPGLLEAPALHFAGNLEPPRLFRNLTESERDVRDAHLSRPAFCVHVPIGFPEEIRVVVD